MDLDSSSLVIKIDVLLIFKLRMFVAGNWCNADGIKVSDQVIFVKMFLIMFSYLTQLTCSKKKTLVIPTLQSYNYLSLCSVWHTLWFRKGNMTDFSGTSYIGYHATAGTPSHASNCHTEARATCNPTYKTWVSRLTIALNVSLIQRQTWPWWKKYRSCWSTGFFVQAMDLQLAILSIYIFKIPFGSQKSMVVLVIP